MTETKALYKQAMRMLKETSRTFYIPIQMLPSVLKRTVGSAYLCMRAIDEIEDHEQLDTTVKANLLRKTSELLKTDFDEVAYQALLSPYAHVLPEVTLRLGDWLRVCADGIVDKVKDATQTMALGMADWAERQWNIETEADLDDYTYYVAGLVGVMLSDIWRWHDGTETDRDLAISYGRGLQAVNILRNKEEDMHERGVGFFPTGWKRDDMFQYAERNLADADLYMKDIQNRKITLFCKIPLALAKRTLAALKRGEEKMSRTEVEETVESIIGE